MDTKSFMTVNEYYRNNLTYPHMSRYKKDIPLYDERNISEIHRIQFDREIYVKKKLFGVHTDDFDKRLYKLSRINALKNVDEKYMMDENADGTALLSQKRIEKLKEKIRDIRDRRLRLMSEGEARVRGYMEILQKEQEEFARETKEMRKRDEELHKRFIYEVENLNKRVEESRKPLQEIKKEIRERIRRDKNHIVDIDDIHMTEKTDKGNLV